jgi:hypothetical protein
MLSSATVTVQHKPQAANYQCQQRCALLANKLLKLAVRIFAGRNIFLVSFEFWRLLTVDC